MNDRNHFHLGKLMLADHAARILARRPGFRPKTRRPGGQTLGQVGLVKNLFRRRIGQGHFGGRN